MMEHIRQFDWCSSTPDRYFVDECDLDNCATQKILRNKFYDPLISSDSENEAPNNINWDDLFRNKQKHDTYLRVFVPGLRKPPPYPKLSALTTQQHLQCLKVLCSENPQILEAEFLPRPTKQDHKVFEDVKETYAKEQIEFIEWAKTLWASDHCLRALRPKPSIEEVYKAEYQMRVQRMQTYPKSFELAAQIPLETKGIECSLVHIEDLISVNATELPEVHIPEMIVKKFSIIRPCTLPEACVKHPCHFILPNESSASMLPITELHRELAQFSLERGCGCVASEGALKCLLEADRAWALPVAVVAALSPEGDTRNVLVLGSEFPIQKETAPVRTYKAYRHLLEHALIPSSEKMKLVERGKGTLEKTNEDVINNAMSDSDSDDDNLLIDTDFDAQMKETESDRETTDDKELDSIDKEETVEKSTTNTAKDKTASVNDIGIYTCTCKDSLFEKPPPRSYKKWQIKNKNSGEKYDLIVHCSHKARSKVGEIIIEPIPEYQIDLGASVQSRDKIKTTALSLLLRRNASLLNVRVDSPAGDVVTLERVYAEQFTARHGDVTADVTNTLHTTLSQLQGLVPGNYVLLHEPSHGSNALLYTTRALGTGQKLSLNWTETGECEDAKTVKEPPTLVPVLLPCHKFRKILPCAFTPNPKLVAKEPTRPATKPKQPPKAIKLNHEERTDSRKHPQWPKRKRNKKKKNNN